MSRAFPYEFSTPPRRVKIAGVLGAGVLSLLALDAGLELQPAPVPPTPITHVAAQAEPSAVRNLSYYPEQLAVLNSLASFKPEADAGIAAPEPAANAVKPPAPVSGDVKPARRAEAAAKPPGALVHAAATPTATAAQDNALKIFGIAIPGAAMVADRAASVRDGAARWGEAALGLGGKVAGIGR